MVECPELNWNVTPINGTSSAFFTPENYDRYCYTRTFDEELDFEVYLKKRSEALQCKFPSQAGNETDTQSAHDEVSKEKRYPVSSGHAHSSAGTLKLETGKHGATCTVSGGVQQKVLPFPRKSWLNSADQRRYLELYNKYNNCPPQNPTEGERIEMNILKELQTKVTSEQEEFQSYLQQVAECNIQSYNYLHPGAKKYMEEKISHSCKRVRQYPRYYETVDAVSLSIPLEQKEFPPLVYVRPLLELGQVPKVILPNILCGAKPNVPTDYDKVAEQLPPAGRKPTDSNMWNKQACSQDWNAEVLAQKYGCKIVLSSGGLKCLLDNHAPGYQSDWQLPVIVKEYPVTENGKTFMHKVVFIDKPFVNQKMTEREKNCKFHKVSLKSLVCNVFKSYKFGSKKSESINEIQPIDSTKQERGQKKANRQNAADKTKNSAMDAAEDFFGSSDLGMENLETFGTSKELNRKEGNIRTNLEHSQDRVSHPVENEIQQCTTPFDNTLLNQSSDELSPLSSVKAKEDCGGFLKVENKISTVEEETLMFSQKLDSCEIMAGPSTMPESCSDDTQVVKDTEGDEMKDTEASNILQDVKVEDAAVSGIHDETKDKHSGRETDECSVSTKETGDTNKAVQQDSTFSPSKISESKIQSAGMISAAIVTLSEESPVDRNLDPLTTATSSVVKSEPVNEDSDVEVIVIKRRRGRPRKPFSKLIAVKKEVQDPKTYVSDITTSVEAREQKEVEDQQTREEKPLAMLSPKQPTVTRMSLRRSPRVLSKTDTNTNKTPLTVQGVPQEELCAKGSNSQSAESSEEDRLVIVEPSSSPMNSPETLKASRVPRPSSDRKQCDSREITGDQESSEEETHLVIDFPQPIEEKGKSLPRRRSLRISGLSADSTDVEGDVLEKSCSQRRVRKSRGKTSNVEVKQAPVESSDEGPERRRSGRLAARGSTRVKEEPTDAAVQETKKRELCQKTNKYKSGKSKITSPDGHDAEPTCPDSDAVASDIAQDEGTKDDHVVKTDVTLKGDRIAVEERSLRNLSEIDEIQEPSDLSETAEEPSLPIIIPLSPVYSRSVTTTTGNESAELLAAKAEGVPENPSNDTSSQSGCTGEKTKQRSSRTRKVQDPLDAILKLQDKMLNDSQSHAPSLSNPMKYPGLPCLSQGHPASSQEHPIQSAEIPLQSPGQPVYSPGLPVQSPGSPILSQEIPSQSPVPPCQSPALPSQPHAPPPHQVSAPSGFHTVKESPLDYHQPLEPLNVTYHLWSFGGRPVLIRCACHGFRRDSNQRVSYLELCTKLEYQTNYGMEQTTASEVVRNWASCYIRQNCPLVRARINALTSELVMLEEIDARRIVPQTQAHLPPQGLQRLNKVLSKLDTLGVGSYLLNHNSGDNHCKIRKAVEGNKRAAYDLHFSYTGFTCTGTKLPTVPPWIPIDPAVVLAFHWNNDRIPVTFDPPDFTAVSITGKKRPHFQTSHFNKGGPKKKKSKKKQSKK